MFASSDFHCTLNLLPHCWTPLLQAVAAPLWAPRRPPTSCVLGCCGSPIHSAGWADCSPRSPQLLPPKPPDSLWHFETRDETSSTKDRELKSKVKCVLLPHLYLHSTDLVVCDGYLARSSSVERYWKTALVVV